MENTEEHLYRVTLTDGKIFEVKSDKTPEEYEAWLKSGIGGILPANPAHYSVPISAANFVKLELLDGNVAVGTAKAGDDEQEDSALREMLETGE